LTDNITVYGVQEDGLEPEVRRHGTHVERNEEVLGHSEHGFWGVALECN
jgi:hypothetical protein